MADTTLTKLKQAEKALVKLRNKIKRADLDYTVQVSISSTDPQTVVYAAQMTSPANGLAPVTFLSNTSPEDLIEKIKEATKHIDYDAVEIAYHKAQMEACDRTKQGHEERINQIENPETDEAQDASELNEENLPVEDSVNESEGDSQENAKE